MAGTNNLGENTLGDFETSISNVDVQAIRQKQRMQIPLAQFSREERSFLALRNQRKVQLMRNLNGKGKMQTQALPDNRSVRKTLLGDWSSHLHRKGQSIDSYNAFKRPTELQTASFLR